jgi:hypothetical protein
MIYKYFGPPGTGKTHKLISRAKAYVKIGTPLNKIGYFAFTKKHQIKNLYTFKHFILLHLIYWI